jgi:polyribonucleotide nucleotidyltransferase
MMVEAGASEVTEAQVAEAISFAFEACSQRLLCSRN